MRNSHLLKKVMAFILLFAIMLSFTPLNVYAETMEVSTFAEISEVRKHDKQSELKEIYKILFPDEYHYIVEYEKNGVREMASNEVETVVYKTASYEDVDYELLIMNNGQVFLNYCEVKEIQDNSKTRGPVNGTFYSKDFTVGDIGHYVTFTIDYLIKQTDYDSIIDCRNISGDGFYLYPTNLSVKWNEDADGPAHYGYNNVSMNMDGSGVLYDIGVGVGNNKAKGISQVSSGADMWVWAFIYAFFGD